MVLAVDIHQNKLTWERWRSGDTTRWPSAVTDMYTLYMCPIYIFNEIIILTTSDTFLAAGAGSWRPKVFVGHSSFLSPHKINYPALTRSIDTDLLRVAECDWGRASMMVRHERANMLPIRPSSINYIFTRRLCDTEILKLDQILRSQNMDRSRLSRMQGDHPLIYYVVVTRLVMTNTAAVIQALVFLAHCQLVASIYISIISVFRSINLPTWAAASAAGATDRTLRSTGSFWTGGPAACKR